ncbi:MAG TPA: phosphoglycolate phosphatase [Thermoprotei archaeon]|nr:phosphoglycolate phosphatase [Thermoprotei archaeon]
MVELSEIQVLVIDIDDTITDELNRVSIEAIEYIRRLEMNGIMTILASGNALPITKGLAHYIGSSGPTIGEAGCAFEYMNEIYILGDPKRTNEAMDRLKRRFGPRLKEPWSNIYRHVDKAIKPTIPKDKIISVLDDMEDIAVLDSKFAYHIHPKDIDKYSALEVISHLINLPPEYFAAIGDSELDIRLIEKVGYGVAVANSPDELKKAADYITEKERYWGFIEFADMLLKEVGR